MEHFSSGELKPSMCYLGAWRGWRALNIVRTKPAPLSPVLVNTMTRKLKAVSQAVEGTPFTEAQMRWWIFNERQNGLNDCGAIVRIGRRVYIDMDALDHWIDSQQHRGAVA